MRVRWLLPLGLAACWACQGGPGKAPSGPVSPPAQKEPTASPNPRPDPPTNPMPGVKPERVPENVDFHALPSDPLDRPQFDAFVDVKICAECHGARHAEWADSTHGRAGGPPGSKTIVAPFDGRVLRFTDATVRPEKKGGRYLFRLNRKGRKEERVQVDAVVGAARIHGGGAQTYFQRHADGRLLNLPFEWSRDAKTWFCQTKDRTWRPIDGTYPLEACDWPPSRTLGSGPGKNCQNCHGSQIRLLFDENEKRFETQYSTLAIDCQACHGPGKAHVAWAKAGAKGADIGLEPLGLLDREASVALCLQCHANKQQMITGYLPGADFTAHYAIAAIRPPSDQKISADGHLTGFGYQQAHLYSPCYLEGSMTCVDCHAPHDLKYRDVHGRALKGRFDDGQCVGCHAAKADTDHSGHQATRCTDCHMRLRQHGGIGQEIRLARADHAITIPRPNTRPAIGVACQDCHPDRSPEIGSRQLFGQLKPQPAMVQALLRQPIIVDEIVTALDTLETGSAVWINEGITQLTGLLLSRRLQLPTKARSALERLGQAESIEVRAAALTALLVLGGPSGRAFVYQTVRTAGRLRPALRSLLGHNLMAADYAFAQIGAEVAAGLRTLLVDVALPLARDPTLAFPIVGSTVASAGDWPRALALYDRAIAWPSPKNGKVPLGLAGPRHQMLGMRAQALLNMNRVSEALATYTRAVATFPLDPNNTEGLCRLLVRSGAHAKAVGCLEKLLQLVPEDFESRLVRAELLEGMARYGEALSEGQRALAEDPTSPRGRALVGRLQNRLGR